MNNRYITSKAICDICAFVCIYALYTTDIGGYFAAAGIFVAAGVLFGMRALFD